MKSNLRKHLRGSYSDQELAQWFDPLGIHPTQDGQGLRVVFPHSLFAGWFEKNIRSKFEDQLHKYLGKGCLVRYEHPAQSGTGSASFMSKERQADHPFGPAFTFESFIPGKSNFFPMATAQDIAKGRDIQYNPLVICGGSGSGKTHLLRAIANEISKNSNSGSVYLSDVDGLNEKIKSYQGDKDKARRELDCYKAFVLDDLQRLRDYPVLQDDLILLFNFLHDSGRQMVLAMDDSLDSYAFLKPQLLSRLKWGLVLTLKEPDLVIRVELINRYCNESSIKLSKNQILTLAQRFDDVRSLQGILLKLRAFRKVLNRSIQEHDFEQIINLTQSGPGPMLNPETVMRQVAVHFEMRVSDITGRSRKHDVVHARQVAMYLCRTLIGCSYPTLGRVFGGKDHSTAMYAIKKIEKKQLDNDDMKKMITLLKKKCLGREQD